MLLALAMTATPLAAQTEATPAALPCPLDRPYDPSNPFAQILRGEPGRQIVAENEAVIVIIPLSWEYPGHALVIPRRPVRSLLDMTPGEMGHALDIARRVGQAQMTAFGATGFTITQNNARNQTVCHAHFHVVPNSPRAPSAEAPAGERDRIGEKLRAALGGPRLPSAAPPGIPRR
jgi:histidine triad (HIT) family protein